MPDQYDHQKLLWKIKELMMIFEPRLTLHETVIVLLTLFSAPCRYCLKLRRSGFVKTLETAV